MRLREWFGPGLSPEETAEQVDRRIRQVYGRGVFPEVPPGLSPEPRQRPNPSDPKWVEEQIHRRLREARIL